jgi:hypothetical protein
MSKLSITCKANAAGINVLAGAGRPGRQSRPRSDGTSRATDSAVLGRLPDAIRAVFELYHHGDKCRIAALQPQRAPFPLVLGADRRGRRPRQRPSRRGAPWAGQAPQNRPGS